MQNKEAELEWIDAANHNKIIVIGCPSSGKSVFSRRLAQALDLPLVHLDALYHQPYWPQEAT